MERTRMNLQSFQGEDISTISEALGIAEERTGDFYQFSLGQWKRHRYDVRTFQELGTDETRPHHAFALLKKGTSVISDFESKSRERDYYFICLHDHQILEALRKDKNLQLLPLLIYVFVHELVHIVRFCNFSQRFDVSNERKEIEEKVVHSTTFEILKGLSFPRMDYVLHSYQNYRICDMTMS
jgi:hypothetical protein